MNHSHLHLNKQVCFPIYSVSRLITKAYKPFLNDLNLTYPQYLVLMVLWEEDGISINQISEKLLLQTNTLSPLLKRMEKMDLLKRQRSNKDERTVIIKLTKKGAHLKVKATCIPEKLLNILVTEKIELTEITHLKEILNQWIEIFSKK